MRNITRNITVISVVTIIYVIVVMVAIADSNNGSSVKKMDQTVRITCKNAKIPSVISQHDSAITIECIDPTTTKEK